METWDQNGPRAREKSGEGRRGQTGPKEGRRQEDRWVQFFIARRGAGSTPDCKKMLKDFVPGSCFFASGKEPVDYFLTQRFLPVVSFFASGNVLGTFREGSGNVPVAFREREGAKAD